MSNLVSCQCMKCMCEFEFQDFPQICDYCKQGKHSNRKYPS
jgi:hypothetical protein